MKNRKLLNGSRFVAFSLLLLAFCLVYSCKNVKYSMKDSSIPANIKTIKMGLFENKARYINPQLAPKLNQNLQTKLVSQTGRQPSTRDDADYVISGFINDYTVSTSGISNGQVSSNRLTVGVHVVLQNNKDQKQDEYDVSKSFEFPGTQTITDVENSLTDQIVTGLTQEIFNKLFSGW